MFIYKYFDQFINFIDKVLKYIKVSKNTQKEYLKLVFKHQQLLWVWCHGNELGN